MSKKSRAKHHTQRRNWHSNPTGGLWVLQQQYARNVQASPLSDEELLLTSLYGRKGFEALLSNTTPTKCDWDEVTNSVNVALLLAEDGYGIEHQDVFIRGQEALVRAYIRNMKTGKWRLDGEGIQAVRDALYLHDQQCELVSNGDYIKAARAVEARIENDNVFEIEAVAA